MNCENTLCVYQEKGSCVLDEIEIDVTGQCSSCIFIDIPENNLEMYKILLRNKIDNY